MTARVADGAARVVTASAQPLLPVTPSPLLTLAGQDVHQGRGGVRFSRYSVGKSVL
jgi:hypothetical protein